MPKLSFSRLAGFAVSLCFPPPALSVRLRRLPFSAKWAGKCAFRTKTDLSRGNVAAPLALSSPLRLPPPLPRNPTCARGGFWTPLVGRFCRPIIPNKNITLCASSLPSLSHMVLSLPAQTNAAGLGTHPFPPCAVALLVLFARRRAHLLLFAPALFSISRHPGRAPPRPLCQQQSTPPPPTRTLVSCLSPSGRFAHATHQSWAGLRICIVGNCLETPPALHAHAPRTTEQPRARRAFRACQNSAQQCCGHPPPTHAHDPPPPPPSRTMRARVHAAPSPNSTLTKHTRPSEHFFPPAESFFSRRAERTLNGAGFRPARPATR
jgi:hypothetical protein